MADTKITALTAITSITPATFPLPIVDLLDTTMAGSGTTKKVTVNQILGCGGTATLASATITGDLTVDTSTLKVDSANNRVGILTTTPTYALDVNGDAKVTNALRYFVGSTQYGLSFANAGALGVESYQGTYIFLGTGSGASATERLRIANDGVCTWSNVGGVAGTAMTLNSTGLGVGGSPATKIFASVAPPSAGQDGMRVSDGTRLIQMSISGSTYSYQGIGANQNVIYASGNPLSILSDAQNLRLGTSSTSYLLLDTSGNVGIGVTPSAWRNTQRALQIGAVGGLFSSAASTGSTCVGRNVYESAAGDFTYIVNDEATFYEQTATGTHAWYTAAAGTGTISFGSPKMTLDASGNLILLSSNTPATLATNGQLTVNATSNTNLRFSYRGSDGVTRVANITLA